ncbi:DUF222 domain-containing protein [Amycolatopsis vastitatis]|uniref:DUF222 domain-containing protein n=1 Tax=Amycolatopsis vastitatis TaxID=1905142 RepID=UPI001F0A9E03|nr:DUF222 domain-containing protein [Amycolatopsis vastitatis]
MTEHALWQSDAVALADRIGSLFACIRSAEAELGALLVEVEQRGVLELFGYRSVPRLLEHLADVPKSSAERMVKRARAVNPGLSLDGTPIPAVAAATGVVARSGQLSNPMIDVIAGVLQDVPPEHREGAERHLLDFAAEAGHRQVAALGARILAHLDPDGAEPDDTEPATPTRELSLRRKRTGIWEINGKLDDETGAPPPAAAPLRMASPHRHRRSPGVLTAGVLGQTAKTEAQQPAPTLAVRGITTAWGQARSHTATGPHPRCQSPAESD